MIKKGLCLLLLLCAGNASATTLTDCLFAPMNKWVICPANAESVTVSNITASGADITITSSELITPENPAYFIVHGTSTTYDNYDSRLLRVDGRECDGAAPGSGEGTNTVTCTVSNLPQGETFTVTAQHFFRFRDGFVGQLSGTFQVAGVQGEMPVCSENDIVAATAGSPLSELRNDARFVDIPGLTAEQNKQFHRDGIVRVDWYGAVRDGVANDWPAINQAVRDAHDYEAGAVYLGSGGILGIDRSANLMRVNNGTADCTTGGSDHNHTVVVYGDKNNKPRLKLLGTTHVDFSNASAPREVVRLWSASGEDPATCTAGEPVDVNGETLYDINKNAFRQELRWVEIDTSGYAGAIGLKAPAAQNSYIVGVDIIADGSYACFDEVPGRLGGVWDSTCSGDGAQFGYSPSSASNSQAFYDARFTGPFQQAAFEVDSRTPSTLAGIYVEQDVSIAPVVRGKPGGSTLASSSGSWDIQDMEIVLTGASAASGAEVFLNNDRGGRSWSIERVYISGAGVGRPIITSGGVTDNFTSAVQSIDRYVYAATDAAVVDRVQGDKTFYDTNPSTNMVDGVVSSAPIKVFGTTAAPADIRQRHRFAYDANPVPMPDSATTLNVLTNACVSNRGQADVRAQLQAVLDEYCGVFDIYLPKGSYPLSGGLTTSADCRVWGINQATTGIYQLGSWQPSGNEYMFTTGTGSGNFTLGGFTAFRDGDNSVGAAGIFSLNADNARIDGIQSKIYPTNPNAPEFDVILSHFGANAGGIVRVLGQPRKDGLSSSSRPYLIENSNGNPLVFHGTNPEHMKSRIYIEVDGAENLKFISNKEECHHTWMSVRNSQNVSVHGFGVGCHQTAGSWVIDVIDSDDVRMSSLLPIYFSVSEPTNFFRELRGGTAVTVNTPSGVTFYERGTFNNAPFEGGAFQ